MDRLAEDEAFRPADPTGTAEPDPDPVGVRRSEALTHLVTCHPTPAPADSGRDHPADETATSGSTSTSRGACATSGSGTVVHLLMDLPTALGLSDAPVDTLEGGQVPAHVARELMTDATFRRLVTDPMTGHLLDYGRRTYRPPQVLQQFVEARSPRCRFPGCRRRAMRCQLDHATPWNTGGRTDRDNLGPLCVRHHQLKTHAGWTITTSSTDGSVTWRSPTGREYAVPPEPLTEPRDPAPPTDPAPPANPDPPPY